MLSLLAVLAVLAILGLWGLRRAVRGATGARSALDWLPARLLDAELLWSEKEFQCREPVAMALPAAAKALTHGASNHIANLLGSSRQHDPRSPSG